MYVGSFWERYIRILVPNHSKPIGEVAFISFHSPDEISWKLIRGTSTSTLSFDYVFERGHDSVFFAYYVTQHWLHGRHMKTCCMQDTWLILIAYTPDHIQVPQKQLIRTCHLLCLQKYMKHNETATAARYLTHTQCCSSDLSSVANGFWRGCIQLAKVDIESLGERPCHKGLLPLETFGHDRGRGVSLTMWLKAKDGKRHEATDPSCLRRHVATCWPSQIVALSERWRRQQCTCTSCTVEHRKILKEQSECSCLTTRSQTRQI